MEKVFRSEFPVHAVIACSMIVLLAVSSNLNWHKEAWKTVLVSDARGYYAYLPAVFIYHDLNFGFFDAIDRGKYFDELVLYEYRVQHEGQLVNKYYAGTALAQLPFFLVADLLSRPLGFERDGYAKIYMLSVTLAALCYCWLGLVWLNVVMKRYGIALRNRIASLLGLLFGTNLFFYTVGEPGMSHVFSFAFVSGFLWSSLNWFATGKRSYLLYMGASLGMITLIRPVNFLIVLLLPFLAGSFRSFTEHGFSLLKNRKQLLLSLAVFLGIVSVQPLIYWLSTGTPWIYSYGSEGFNFDEPHVLDFLFSYKKGLFIYTPFTFLALTAGMIYWRRSTFERFWMLGFLLLLVYVSSSWWNWWYGGSFGARTMIEFLPLFALLLGIGLQGMTGMVKGISLALVFAAVILCQVQTYQYRYYHIHWENMNEESYWESFLRIDRLLK